MSVLCNRETARLLEERGSSGASSPRELLCSLHARGSRREVRRAQHVPVVDAAQLGSLPPRGLPPEVLRRSTAFLHVRPPLPLRQIGTSRDRWKDRSYRACLVQTRARPQFGHLRTNAVTLERGDTESRPPQLVLSQRGPYASERKSVCQLKWVSNQEVTPFERKKLNVGFCIDFK